MKTAMKQQIAIALVLALVIIFAAATLITAMIFRSVPATQANRLNIHIYDMIERAPAQNASPITLGEDELHIDTALRE